MVALAVFVFLAVLLANVAWCMTFALTRRAAISWTILQVAILAVLIVAVVEDHQMNQPVPLF
ncbi:MAG TPA: hypothetical protein VG055_11770 [Planctomycetaceae bacterium]|jgi:hypothetical protein|nr:hypothetical protein [Planctomycetaceae bacterium]